MKVFCTVLVAVLLVVSILEAKVYRVDTRSGNDDDLSLSLELVRADSNSIELISRTSNQSDRDVYIATKPRQMSGVDGHYISIDEPQGLVSMSSRVYPDPPFYAASDDTSVELKRLLPGQSHVEKLLVTPPVIETLPPFDRPQRVRKAISIERIRKLSVSYGYFSEKRVIQVANRRVKGSAIVEFENDSQSSLYELQKIISSELVVPKK